MKCGCQNKKYLKFGEVTIYFLEILGKYKGTDNFFWKVCGGYGPPKLQPDSVPSISSGGWFFFFLKLKKKKKNALSIACKFTQ